jgi:CRP/FNR family transcriptional regulator
MTLSSSSISSSGADVAVAAFTATNVRIADLFDKQPIENFAHGETVFFQGDLARHVFEITEGVMRLCKVLLDGRRIISGFLFPGDVIGLSQSRRYMYGAEAVNSIKLRRISRRSLDEAIDRSSYLRPQIFASMCNEMAAVQEQMEMLSCKNAEERVCSFLVSMRKRQMAAGRSAVVIDLAMTRLDIADHLGMTIETVSRNLTKLAKKGVLAEVERYSVRISKPDALEELSGGCWDDAEDELPSSFYGARTCNSRH